MSIPASDNSTSLRYVFAGLSGLPVGSGGLSAGVRLLTRLWSTLYDSGNLPGNLLHSEVRSATRHLVRE